ncbi:interferon-induced protein with tetratricopeptide repeats 5-like [Gastrophryne carolinensis]
MLEVLLVCGVPVAHDKTEGLATSIKFLGIEIDMVERVCRLPLTRRCLVEMGLSRREYGTHSIRIGAATEAARLGFPVELIQKLWKWVSKRFLSYIRLGRIEQAFGMLGACASGNCTEYTVLDTEILLLTVLSTNIASELQYDFRDPQINTLRDTLKEELLKLQCHFTWNLFVDYVDIDHIEERLNDQIAFLSNVYKHRMFNLLSYLKYHKGDLDEAILQLQKSETQLQESNPAEESDVKKMVMYGNYAWVFYHQNHISKSCTYTAKVNAILNKYESPQIKNHLLLEIYSEQGWSYLSYTCKYYENAVECFEKALKLEPENPDLSSGYAIAVYRTEGLIHLEKPSKKSLPLLERAVKLNPKDTVVKTYLALKHQLGKNYQEAQKLIEEALCEEPESPYVLRYVATFYRRNNLFDKAIEVLKKALKLTPNSASLHNQLGHCYIKYVKKRKRESEPNIHYTQQQEAISNAMFHFEKAVELKKTFASAYIMLAETYIEAKQYQRAEDVFHKLLDMESINSSEKQEFHLKWAQYELWNKKSEAVRHFKEAIMIPTPTFYRQYAIDLLRNLPKKMIYRNSGDDTGYGLLGFIYQHQDQ